jgi:hypothetical protein
MNQERNASEASYFSVDDKQRAQSEIIREKQHQVKESWKVDKLDKMSIESIAEENLQELIGNDHDKGVLACKSFNL